MTDAEKLLEHYERRFGEAIKSREVARTAFRVLRNLNRNDSEKLMAKARVTLKAVDVDPDEVIS